MCHCPQRDLLGEMGLTGPGMVGSPFSTSLLYCFFIFFFKPNHYLFLKAMISWVPCVSQTSV